MNDIIQQIVDIEWTFFDQVQNIGGRADCQDDYPTFLIMRKSQFLCWSEELLHSYYTDLLDYQEKGENPLACKYAYMMRLLSPAEYDAMKEMLPEITDEKRSLVDEIVGQHKIWQRTFYQNHPKLAGRSRPQSSEDDFPGAVSSETYLRCELYTYSFTTLELYRDYVQSLAFAGHNLVAMIMDHTAKFYGYEDTMDVERHLNR